HPLQRAAVRAAAGGAVPAVHRAGHRGRHRRCAVRRARPLHAPAAAHGQPVGCAARSLPVGLGRPGVREGRARRRADPAPPARNPMNTSVPLASAPLAGAAPRAWRDPTILVAIVINLAIYLYALAVSRGGGGDSLDLLLVEDGLVEWLQFLAFATLAVVLALIALDRAARGGGRKLEVLVLLGMSGVVALAAMEEISWFQ